MHDVINKTPPSLQSGLQGLLALGGSALIGYLSISQENISIPKSLAVPAGAALAAIIWGCLSYVYLVRRDYSLDLRETRKKKLERWREFMAKDFEQMAFSGTVVYSEMRPHLSPASIAAIEGHTITVRIGRVGNIVATQILEDLAGLEKKWKLI